MKAKDQEEKPQWDIKKILLFLVTLLILAIIGFELKSIILGDKVSPQIRKETAKNQSDVKGAGTENVNMPNIKQDIQGQISNLKAEASNINLIDVASSSPQVQKVINDLKALQNYPSNKIKDTCVSICNRL